MELTALAGLGPAAYTPASTSAKGAAPALASPTLSGAQPGAPAQSADSPATGLDKTLAEEKAFANVMNDRFKEACRTCKNRRYQDGSNDASVSFQTPQNIAPEVSASVVMAHEKEHVANEQANARREGGEVLSQTVQLHGGICPECGRYYIAGGTTTTVTRHGGESNAAQGGENEGGLDITA